eukprot:g5056.t1
MNEEEQIPESVARALKTHQTFHSQESAIRALTFKPGPNDVTLSMAPKSGTTLFQQICHGLRSNGDMNFEEISLVFPHLEMAYDGDYGDLYAPQPYQPQMYKTHFWYDDTPKGAGNELVSYPHRLEKNVFWLHYEDIIENRRECVRLIAEFLNIGVDNVELQELVTKQSNIEFMREHFTKFDSHVLRNARNEAAGLAKDAGLTGKTGKVRTGVSDGTKDVFPKWIMDEIDAQWNEV